MPVDIDGVAVAENELVFCCEPPDFAVANSPEFYFGVNSEAGRKPHTLLPFYFDEAGQPAHGDEVRLTPSAIPSARAVDCTAIKLCPSKPNKTSTFQTRKIGRYEYRVQIRLKLVAQNSGDAYYEVTIKRDDVRTVGRRNWRSVKKLVCVIAGDPEVVRRNIENGTYALA